MTILGLFLNKEMRTGANRRYLELMEALAQKGQSVFVIMNTGLDYTPRFFTRIDIPVNYKRKGFPPASFLFKKAVKANRGQIHKVMDAAAIHSVDWIHIHGDMHLAAALYLKKAFKAKLFFAFRCNDITRAQIMRKERAYSTKEFILSYPINLKDRIREKTIAAKAELITFQNTTDRDIFIKRTGTAGKSEKTVIIPGNIGLPRFTKETEGKNTSTGVTSLVYVGSVSLSKGLQHLLGALAILKDRGHEKLHLSVLGRMEHEGHAFALIRKLGIERMVSFEGYTLPFPYLEKSDLMVYPTLYDAFPDTILEALHVGCPVIATRIGGVPDILGNDDLLFELGDIQAIANRIERCVTDPDYYKSIRATCRERADLFRFDWAERFAIAMKEKGIHL